MTGEAKFEVIPSKSWERDDGKRASIYGAVPWLSEAERHRWKVVENGWTVLNPHTGEVGACRVPWKTKAEAQAFADNVRPSRTPYGA